MDLYRINKDGFNIGQAKGKKNAIQWLRKYLEFEGITKSNWTAFKYHYCRIITMFHEFTIERFE